ncbi:MAG TPA: hypothetical protein DEB31_09855, partial [Clostridiales bacterium]|nr:hypothetical protein [Clostridiales bacterium]
MYRYPPANRRGAERCVPGHEELAEAAERFSIFGRVKPAQKRALISALQGKGHTVAMVGDGV